MDIAPFNAPVSAKGWAKVINIRDGTEVAARPPFRGRLSGDGSFSRT
jgi:hypothetical protein